MDVLKDDYFIREIVARLWTVRRYGRAYRYANLKAYPSLSPKCFDTDGLNTTKKMSLLFISLAIVLALSMDGRENSALYSNKYGVT